MTEPVARKWIFREPDDNKRPPVSRVEWAFFAGGGLLALVILWWIL